MLLLIVWNNIYSICKQFRFRVAGEYGTRSNSHGQFDIVPGQAVR